MKKSLIVLILLLLIGCTPEKNANPILEVVSRIQVDYQKEFDYQTCVLKAYDEEDGELMNKVEVSNLDTSKKGTQELQLSLTDSSGNTVKKTLKVDVVERNKEGIYSPLDVKPDTVKDPKDMTTMVNKVNQIPEGWVPDDLEPVIDNKDQKLRKEANEAYTKFYNAAKEKGIDIYSISGYRTHDKQTLYWNNQVKVFGEEYASKYSAYPGRSEHQLGLAIDISYTTTGNRLSDSVASSDIGKFIVSDGYRYGFILRYPADKMVITNYAYEPWHIRYVGVELATKLHEKNITLEEYNQ